MNQNRNRVGKRLAACAAAGTLAAAMLTAAALAGAAPAGAASAPHKSAAAASSNTLPPIRSADGKIAPSTSGAGGWHVAHARSGPGHSSMHALHVFLPRTNKLVAPSGSSRGVPQHAAPGAGTNHTAGVAPPRSLNVRPPAGAPRSKGDIVIGTNFNGSGYTGWIPPDGGLATGPHQVIVAINGAFNVFGKGGAVLSSQSLASFFSGLPDASTAFDPHVQFDPNSGRFWVAAAASDGTTSSEIFVAVSNDSDALHGWSIFWMPVQGNFPHDWCDYPQIGLSSGGFVYLTCNMFSLPNAGGTATPMIRIMPESEFTGGGCCSWWEFWNLAGWSIQPTVMLNSATGNVTVSLYDRCVMSIAAKRTKLASTKTLRPFRPGKSGRRRGARNDDPSAKAMKTAATTAMPILCPVESPASSTGLFHQIVRRRGAVRPSAAATPRRAQRRARTG